MKAGSSARLQVLDESGADIGDRLSSTIGYERRFNAFLQFQNVESFTDYALSTAPPAPTYYPRMKKLNAEGPEVLGNLPKGELLFFGLYFMMTGLHALHVLVGMVLLAVTIARIAQRKVTSTHFSLHENSGLYWHLVDFIWLFLFPLLHIVT